MARKARAAVLYDGCYAHVFSRSIEKRRIFQDQQDFSFFKDLFVKAKGQSPFFVFHYCFMHTHFHLVVGIRSLEAFSRGMQWVKWQYTRAYNLKYKRWGPLWRERFKSMLIEDEKYLYVCGCYIEQNPVKAGIVERGSDWEHSSARHYEGHHRDGLIDEYEQQGNPNDVDVENEEEFMRGWVIGSDWFRYKLQRGIS